jgi:hypothetical protein
MNPSNRLLSQSDVYKVFRPLRVENYSLFWSQNMILGVFDMSKWWYLIWYRHFFPWRSYKNRPPTCPPLYVQRRVQRTFVYRQARSFAFCTSAELARIPRIQVQSSHPALAGRSKPRRRHRTIPLARAPYRTIARSPPSPHSPSQQAQPEHQSAADFNISFPARPVARSPALLFTSPVFC